MTPDMRVLKAAEALSDLFYEATSTNAERVQERRRMRQEFQEALNVLLGLCLAANKTGG